MKQADRIHGYHNCMATDDDKYYLGIYPVMFGFRLRAGRVDDPHFCRIDLCCGTDLTAINMAYYIIAKALDIDPDRLFEGYRDPKVKPYLKDPDFKNWLFTELAEQFKTEDTSDWYIPLTEDDLIKARQITFDEAFAFT